MDNPQNNVLTREELLEMHNYLCREARDLMEQKNHDYGGAQEVFGNLQACEDLGICSTEQGILIRMVDKLSRLINFEKQGKFSVDESVDDNVQDLINYSVLYRARKASRGQPSPTHPEEVL